MAKRINQILDSIMLSLKSHSYYCALISAITLPDICGEIEFPENKSKERYIKWFNKYLDSKYNRKGYKNSVDFLIPDNCYALRCSLLHKGKADISDQKSQKGGLNQIHFHTNRFDKGHCNLDCDCINGLQLNVDRFCLDIIEGVKKWLNEIEKDLDKKSKIDLIFKIRDV